jgi:hypothetical protein
MSRSTKSISAKKHGSCNINAILCVNLLGVSSEISLTRSYIENYTIDLFVTFKVGQGQPKAFQQRSMGQGTILPSYIEIRSVVSRNFRIRAPSAWPLVSANTCQALSVYTGFLRMRV